jgi:iduronate 2-sulfatase
MDTTFICVILLMVMLFASSASKKMNVLFLVSDDMRPELSAYLGKDFPSPVHPPVLHSPNLDKLANRSLLLKRAYVQQAVCSPSRTSLLTGR